MALNALEMKIVSSLLLRTPDARTLLLGYPDLLCNKAVFEQVGFPMDWEALPKRPDAAAMWSTHNRSLTCDAPDTRGFFRAFGAEIVVVDANAWGGEDRLLDLNWPLSQADRKEIGQFDLIVDPGTLEHCFNIAQAFDNVVQMLKPGGMVFHEAAISFPNHGFWSISPTAFFDYYQSKGFSLGSAYVTHGPVDEFGFIPRLAKIAPFDIGGVKHTPAVGYFVFQRGHEHPRPGYPIQRCYSDFSRDIEMVDWIGDAVREHQSLAQKVLS